MLTVLTGGARSGKSALAVEWGLRHRGPVVFVATAPLLDDDMRARARRHREERPGWPTVEEQHDFDSTIADAPADGMVIVDCITLWVSNLMWRGDEDSSVLESASRLAGLARASSAKIVAVTNEVGLGIHPETELGRRYRDLLGRVNRVLVESSDRSYLLVAGRPLELPRAEDVQP
jgi:adenosylcobinamide kinase/adenosylcobinamide-phosphate guanylyltransferase